MASRAEPSFEPSITRPARSYGTIRSATDRAPRVSSPPYTGLTFTGDVPGNLMALRTSDGTTLWHQNIGRMGNAPETYELDGKQVLLVAGGGALIAFTLP